MDAKLSKKHSQEHYTCSMELPLTPGAPRAKAHLVCDKEGKLLRLHQQPVFLRAKHPAEPTLAAEGHGRERVRVGSSC